MMDTNVLFFDIGKADLELLSTHRQQLYLGLMPIELISENAFSHLLQMGREIARSL